MHLDQVGERRFTDEGHGIRHGPFHDVGDESGEFIHFLEFNTAVDTVINLNHGGDFGQGCDVGALAQAVHAGVDEVGAALQTRIQGGARHTDVVVGVEADLRAGQQALHLADDVCIDRRDCHAVDVVELDHVGARVHEFAAYFSQPFDRDACAVLNQAAHFPVGA